MLLDFGLARHMVPSLASRPARWCSALRATWLRSRSSAQAPLTPSADIFSLGCVLYECLTGKAALHRAPLRRRAGQDPLHASPSPCARPAPELPVALRGAARAHAGQGPRAPASRTPPACWRPWSGSDSPAATSPRPRCPRATAPAGLVGAEQQLVSVLLAAPRAAERALQRTAGLVRTPCATRCAPCSRPTGAQVELLADGSLVATLVAMHGSATDPGRPRGALRPLIQERWPEAAVVLTTGRGRLASDLPVGEAMDRAGQLLRQLEALVPRRLRAGAAGRGHRGVAGPWLPALPRPAWRVPAARRAAWARMPPAPCWASPPLCGPGAGADPAGAGLHHLRAGVRSRRPCWCRPRRAWASPACATSSSAAWSEQGQHGAGAAGPGRSHERRLGGWLARTGTPPAVRHHRHRAARDAQARAARSGSRLAPARGHRPRRWPSSSASCVASPSRTSTAPGCAPPAGDPQLMSTQVGRALVTFLRAECAHHPVLLVLEDLHWGDALTVRLVDEALRELAEQPLMVLALSRPEVEQLLPRPRGRRRTAGARPARTEAARRARGWCARCSARRCPTPSSIGSWSRRPATPCSWRSSSAERRRAGARPRRRRCWPCSRRAWDGWSPGARQVLLAASLLGRTFWDGGVCGAVGRGALAPEAGATGCSTWWSWSGWSRNPPAAFRVEHRVPLPPCTGAGRGLRAGAGQPQVRSVTGGRASGWSRPGRAIRECSPSTPGWASSPSAPSTSTPRPPSSSSSDDDMQGLERCMAGGPGAGAPGRAGARLRALQATTAFWMDDFATMFRLGRTVLPD